MSVRTDRHARMGRRGGVYVPAPRGKLRKPCGECGAAIGERCWSLQTKVYPKRIAVPHKTRGQEKKGPTAT